MREKQFGQQWAIEDQQVSAKLTALEKRYGKLRDELLNRELFLNLEEARWVADRWRLGYNRRRLHSALDYQTPPYSPPACSRSASPLCQSR